MKWLGGWHRHPELSRFPSDEDAKKAFQGATPKWPFFGLLFAGIMFARVIDDYAERHAGKWAGILAFFMTTLVWAELMVFLLRKRIQRHLRNSLLSHGVPICIPCGYDLRGQTEPRCPECGTSFDPALLDETEKNSTNGSDES